MSGRAQAVLSMILLTIPSVGCSTLGPRTIRSDRFNYNQAGAESSKEQMLLNLVRLRYGEPLYFLEISSMLSQFSIEAAGSFSTWQNDLHGVLGPKVRAAAGVDGDASEQTTFGANLGYTDKPTITYRPIQGEEFSRRVMTPITPGELINLAKSGWSIDRLLSCCVQSINGISNRALHDSNDSSARDTSKFERLTVLMKKFQDSGQQMFATEVQNGAPVIMIYVPESIAGLDSELREARELLDYPPTGDLRLRITDNAYRRSPEELAIHSRSLLACLYAMTHEINVPPAHRKKTDSVVGSMPADNAQRGAFLHVEHSRLPQADPFAQVYYNGYWFYISNDDWSSKRTFALFTYLFSLQATNAPGATAPVVAVGAGR
ncbi:MAG: hypothetical protein HZA51_00265 [Planctomycetes bacterium]|nr:hypothetical protein [Planctomycetota bacterium]